MITNPASSIQSGSLTTTEVTSALDGILNTDKFQASPQMSAFLRYVVEQTLIGNTRRIKAFTVGIEALGKPASFDPQTDPSVRVLAKRLRSSLDTYYGQNQNTEVFIEMKPGSYVPKFLRRCDMPVATPEGGASDYNLADTVNNVNSVSMAADTSEPTRTETSAASQQKPQEAAQQPDHSSEEYRPSAHISVAQQHNPAARTATESTASLDVVDEKRTDRNNTISQLWQTDKSASKVA